ncbi:MAG: hypothetical protein A2233_02735 [Candidatus Kerfeldbacteria bacterium RIFOXYA2_FULL_38_24]|nr:MAG: hypothetical protein A2233_02735 [Candidatus Kerfeldbacteria bacterium RIFOXYA2_FULL_38_24]
MRQKERPRIFFQKTVGSIIHGFERSVMELIDTGLEKKRGTKMFLVLDNSNHRGLLVEVEDEKYDDWPGPMPTHCLDHCCCEPEVVRELEKILVGIELCQKISFDDGVGEKIKLSPAFRRK